MTPEETRQKLIHSLDKNVLAALAAKNFDVFASVMLPDHFKNPSSIFHRHLMATVSENQMTAKREVIVGPRGWGKSTTISEGGIAWIICRDNYLPVEQQYKYIMLISDSAKQAKERLESIKAMLTSEPMIAEYYPHVFGEGKIWREDRIVTKNDILIDTRGMTASSRGTKYKNRRPNLVIADDTDSMDTAMSPTMAEDLQERFTKDVLKFGDKKTDVIVVGTVLSKLCLVYKLLYADEFASWNGRIVKALEKFPERMDLWDRWGSILNNRKISNRSETAELFYAENKEEMEKGGISNWPEVWPVKDLMYEYYTLGRRAFMSEMQNQITDSELNHFQPHKYTYISETEFTNIIDHNPIIYAYVDPTVGIMKKTRLNSRGSDMFNITLVAKIDNGYYVLVESISRQCRQSEQFDMILDALKKYNIFRLMVESNGGQMHYINALEKAVFEKYAEPEYSNTCKTKYPLKPRAVNNYTSKDERIQMLEPYLDNKTLHLREDMQSSSPELWESLSTYPACEYMDPLDGLSGAFFSAYRTYRLSYLNQAAS